MWPPKSYQVDSFAWCAGDSGLPQRLPQMAGRTADPKVLVLGHVAWDRSDSNAAAVIDAVAWVDAAGERGGGHGGKVDVARRGLPKTFKLLTLPRQPLSKQVILSSHHRLRAKDKCRICLILF